jgi:hypothetical protein
MWSRLSWRLSGSRLSAPGAPCSVAYVGIYAPFPFAIDGRTCSEPISIANHLLSSYLVEMIPVLKAAVQATLGITA